MTVTDEPARSVERMNGFGQPVGTPLPGWTPCPAPPDTPMVGQYGRLERLNADRHGPTLHRHNLADTHGRDWTYLAYGPFAAEAEYLQWVRSWDGVTDPQFWAIVDGHTNEAAGVAAYLRVDAPNGVIEVGHIRYAPALQRTRLATEAMYLMMRRVFDELGYRRYEWKCDSLNAPSWKAAERLGFTYEGLFRQARVNRGRNRDSAWFSIIDSEWPRLSARFQTWLDPSNFDEAGAQRRTLEQSG